MTRILLIGGDADFNVGDAAIRRAVCTELVRRDPQARITIVSARGDELPPLPGVMSTLRKGLRAGPSQWRCARSQDLVVVAGGGLFQDDDSRVKMPYWGARLAALRTACPVVLGHSLGAGPLDHPESHWAARLACSVMRQVTVRDEFARQALQPFSRAPLEVVPDPAFMLEPAPPEAARQFLAGLGVAAGRPLLGVVLRSWFHARGGFIPRHVRARFGAQQETGAEQMAALTDNLAPVITRLARKLDADVLLMPSYLADHEKDEQACAALAAALPGVRAFTARIADPCLYKAVAGQLSLLVSARMHPLILASGMGVPIVGMGYNSKFAGCMQALGAGTQLMWIERLTSAGAAAALERCADISLANRQRVTQRAVDLGERGRAATARLLDFAA